MDKNERKERFAFTRLELITLVDALREHCKKGNDDFAVYNDGWSDQRLADMFTVQFKHLVPLDSVKRLRQEIIGELPRGGSKSHFKYDELELRVRALEQNMARRPTTMTIMPPEKPSSSLGLSLSTRVEGMERKMMAFEDMLERLVTWARTDPRELFTRDLKTLIKEWSA